MLLTIKDIIEEFNALKLSEIDFNEYIEYVSKMEGQFPYSLTYYFLRKEIVVNVQYVVCEIKRKYLDVKKSIKNKAEFIELLDIAVGNVVTERQRNLNESINRAISMKQNQYIMEENYIEKLKKTKRYFQENNLFKK